MSVTNDQQIPNGSRLVGWKAIAGHLGVSQRTAVRWAETYHLPVSRVPRGDRPIVFSTVDELDEWWRSPAAAPIRGEAPSAQELAGDSVDVGVEPSRPEKKDSIETIPKLPFWQRRGIGSLALGFGLLLIVLAGWYASGFRWSSASDRTLAGRTRDGAHGEALSARRIRLTLAVGEQATSVVVAEGEMARIETATTGLGLQGRLTNGGLKVFYFRLGRIGSRESATYVESHDLAAGGVDRLPLDELSVRLSWQALEGAAGLSQEPAKEPCCMVCNGVAVCGEIVSGQCGRCDATAPR
jgi:hypothetical protein